MRNHSLRLLLLLLLIVQVIPAQAEEAVPAKNPLETLFQDFVKEIPNNPFVVGDRIYSLNKGNIVDALVQAEKYESLTKKKEKGKEGEEKWMLPIKFSRYKALKCSKYDYRVFRLCPEAEFFAANARVYFDNGKDEADEVDLFKNGNIEPALQFASVRLPWRFGRAAYYDPWSWGPEFSFGLGSAAIAKEGETRSTAPVALFSAGLRLTYEFNNTNRSNFSLEIGRVFGFSTDETFGDSDDSATYVGIKINIAPKEK